MVSAPSPLAIPAARTMRLAAPHEWWHLLSLDAPTVAALWSWSMARALHIALPPIAPLLLALGTWLVYVADRILDGLPRHLSSSLRERHFFYARHRRAFLIAGIPAVLLLGWLVLRMAPLARTADTVLIAIALLYFGLIHLHGPKIERWFPKELFVGAVFAVATAVPVWSRVTAHSFDLGWIVLLFTALCWVNCAAIEKWERLATIPSQSNRSTRWAQQHLGYLCLAIALIAAIGCAAGILSGAPPERTLLYLACLLSAAILFLLDRSMLSAFHLRIAADAALLTPLILFFAAR